MRKIMICLIFGMIITQGLIAIASEEDINNFSHQVTIVRKDNYLSVVEKLVVKGDSNESYDELTVWIQTGANNIDVLVNSNQITPIKQDDNEYICNISGLGITKEDYTYVNISYELGKSEVFSKKFVRAIDSISVKFGDEDIFSGSDLAVGAVINLQLYEPTEAPLDWFIAIFIILLLILIVVLVIYSFRKRKTFKIKDIASESVELLNTKKTLLMSLLKDIEKQHRAKQISDETYHKLKDRYKQEAVEAMKKLEDMESKD